MIVLSEDSPRLTPSPSARSLKSVTEAARIAGCRVHYIPQEEVGVTATEALSYVPLQEAATAGVWLGYIPSSEWYAALYEAALRETVARQRTLPEQQNYKHLMALLPDTLSPETRQALLQEGRALSSETLFALALSELEEIGER